MRRNGARLIIFEKLCTDMAPAARTISWTGMSCTPTVVQPQGLLQSDKSSDVPVSWLILRGSSRMRQESNVLAIIFVNNWCQRSITYSSVLNLNNWSSNLSVTDTPVYKTLNWLLHIEWSMPVDVPLSIFVDNQQKRSYFALASHESLLLFIFSHSEVHMVGNKGSETFWSCRTAIDKGMRHGRNVGRINSFRELLFQLPKKRDTCHYVFISNLKSFFLADSLTAMSGAHTPAALGLGVDDLLSLVLLLALKTVIMKKIRRWNNWNKVQHVA